MIWSVHAVECYSGRKKNEALTQATTGHLGNTTLSERSQSQKATHCLINAHEMSVQANRQRQKAHGGCEGWGVRGSGAGNEDQVLTDTGLLWEVTEYSKAR